MLLELVYLSFKPCSQAFHLCSNLNYTNRSMTKVDNRSSESIQLPPCPDKKKRDPFHIPLSTFQKRGPALNWSPTMLPTSFVTAPFQLYGDGFHLSTPKIVRKLAREVIQLFRRRTRHFEPFDFERALADRVRLRKRASNVSALHFL